MRRKQLKPWYERRVADQSEERQCDECHADITMGEIVIVDSENSEGKNLAAKSLFCSLECRRQATGRCGYSGQ